MTTYTPQPIDTTNIELNERQQHYVERLAANTHDVWAAKRISDGWRYGPTRHDSNKTHPCLVPYDELPESEKEYDRAVAREAVAVLLILGVGV